MTIYLFLQFPGRLCDRFLSFLCFAGYAPQDLYSLNSKYGSEHQLKALLHKMKQHKVRAMADIVINHRVGTTRGRGGIYNRFDGISLPWDERAVTSSTGGLVISILHPKYQYIFIDSKFLKSASCVPPVVYLCVVYFRVNKTPGPFSTGFPISIILKIL